MHACMDGEMALCDSVDCDVREIAYVPTCIFDPEVYAPFLSCVLSPHAIACMHIASINTNTVCYISGCEYMTASLHPP